MSAKCRLCLKHIPIESVIQLYYFLPEATEPAEIVQLIAKYLHITVEKDDNVSTFICQECNNQLEDFHKFCEDIVVKQVMLQNECQEAMNDEEAMMVEFPIDVVKNEFVSDKEDDDFCEQDILKDNTDEMINYSCLMEEDVAGKKISEIEQAIPVCPIDVVKSELGSGKEDEVFCVNVLNADVNESDFEEYPHDYLQSSDDDIQQTQLKTRKMKTNKFTSTPRNNNEKLDINNAKQSKEPKQKAEREPKLSGDKLIANSFELKCDICQAQVSTWRELWQHFVLAAHTRTPYIKCCGTVYEKEQTLADHMQWHKNPDAFKCQLCDEHLMSSRDLTAHISAVHPDNVDLLQKYECEQCFKQFRNFTMYNNHLRTHSKDSGLECHVRNKRHKITTQNQFARMVQLLEEKPELARSYPNSMGKLKTKEEWNKIAAKLNSIGPPSRQGFEWLKVWADYKCNLKKKLIHNQTECNGSYKQYYLSPTEEAAASLLQLSSIVNPEGDSFGIQQTMTMGTERILEEYTEEEDEGNEATTSSNIRKQAISKPSTSDLITEQLKVQSDLYTEDKHSVDERCSRKTHKTKEEKLKLYKSFKTGLTRSTRKYIAVDFMEEIEDHEEISRRRLRDSSNVLEMPTNQFVDNFRVSKDIFILLLRMLEGKWATGFRSTAIRPDVKLATFLRFTVTGCYQETVGNECVSSTGKTSVSRIIRECLKLFDKWICPEWIKMPSSEEERSIMDAFFDIAGFPGVMGCVDGTHIRIKSPGDDLKRRYYNKDAYYSINAMMVCDHKMTITYIDARHPGANHDSLIWEQSPLDQRLRNAFDNGNGNSWLLGDGGYKLKPFLMTPFRVPKDAAERLYNKKHATARNVIVRCIKLLKNRFRCLIGDRRLHYDPERATQIINACCALHNMCIKYKCSVEPIGTLEIEEDNVTNNDFNDDFEPRALAIRRGIAINL